MYTPRFIRQHSIVIKNKLANEVDGDAVYIDTELKFVKVQGRIKDDKYQRTKATNNFKVSDEIIITIDLSDPINKEYISFDAWDETDSKWTIHSEGDSILFNDLKLIVKSFSEITPFYQKPQLLEIRCQRG